MSGLEREFGQRGQRGLSAMRRIAVLRALQLGDLLCAVPALRALRAAAPLARITLIGLPWAADFVERYAGYLDDFLEFPGAPGFPEREPDRGAMPRFLEQARQCGFDLALQMHGSGGLSNPLVVSLGARCNAGFCEPGGVCPDPARFIAWNAGEHEVMRYLRLMENLGAPSQGEALEFPLFEEDWQALRQHAGLPAPGTYVCIHPGARMPSRRWPPRRFAEVADRCADGGLHVVLTGTAEERPIVDAVKEATRAQAIDLCGRTGLGALAALIAGARLVVCNDTGVSHVAAALATPSVIVCCGSDPVRWAPLDTDRHAVASASVACRPCMHFSCPIGHPCAANVDAHAVLSIARRILAVTEGEAFHERSSLQTHPGHRRRRLSRIASVRVPAGAGG